MKYSEELLKTKCSVEGYYVLSSRQVTEKYYNLKDLYCRNHNFILDYFFERIKSDDFDCIVGLELGGSLIAVGLGVKMNKPIAIFRKEKPSLGKPFKKCLIVEDVSSTGASINILKKWIADADAEVFDVIIGIHRRKPIKKNGWNKTEK